MQKQFQFIAVLAPSYWDNSVDISETTNSNSIFYIWNRKL